MKFISLLVTVPAKRRAGRKIFYKKGIILSLVFLCSINPALSTSFFSKKLPPSSCIFCCHVFPTCNPSWDMSRSLAVVFPHAAVWSVELCALNTYRKKQKILQQKGRFLGRSTQKQGYFVMCWWDGQHHCMNRRVGPVLRDRSSLKLQCCSTETVYPWRKQLIHAPFQEPEKGPHST